MPTLDQTTQEVLNLATTHFKLAPGTLAPDDDFFKKLGIDSHWVSSQKTMLLLYGGMSVGGSPWAVSAWCGKSKMMVWLPRSIKKSALGVVRF